MSGGWSGECGPLVVGFADLCPPLCRSHRATPC